MTGFGQAEEGAFKVEVRSLNHRFLEINVKLPQGMMEHESAIRNAIKGRFARGRFDVFVNVRPEKLKASFNYAAASELYSSLELLRKELAAPAPPGISELVALRDFFITQEAVSDPAMLMKALELALGQVGRMRTAEGALIHEDIAKRAVALEAIRGQIEKALPAVLESAKAKYIQRIKSMLSDASVDEARLLQEASILAEKADIAEELTRIGGHIERMKKILASGDTIGRELDFILQELHREANTLGSKAEDLEIIRKAIEFKTEAERAKQQVQNLQ